MPALSDPGGGVEVAVDQEPGKLLEAPRDYDALRALLIARRETLPKRLKQLATFAIDHPEDIAFGTVAEIAEHAGVQPSTLVRFAQTLGYGGFSPLQQVFRARLRERFPDYRERLRVLRGAEAKGSRSATLLDGFLGAASLSLDRLRDTVTPRDLNRAIETLAKAETIYLLGARRVFPVTAYLAYAFGKLGIRAILIDHVAQLGPEQLSTATPRDAVLAISFTPYAPITAELAATASRRNVPVIAITDSAFSPLVYGADVWIEVAEADYGAFRSLSASFALAMTLAVGTGEKRAEG
ncbi:MAG TPA: MurR/RpiR family transcriptional regulator [Microvirga sp.]|jgi:DNA-binding MurR/RpiR family transcriptional regulator